MKLLFDDAMFDFHRSSSLGELRHGNPTNSLVAMFATMRATRLQECDHRTPVEPLDAVDVDHSKLTTRIEVRHFNRPVVSPGEGRVPRSVCDALNHEPRSPGGPPVALPGTA